MSMITNSARFLLFGPKLDAKITLGNVAKRKAINVARGAFGMPPTNGPGFIDWLLHQAKQLVAKLFGYSAGPQLPADLPVALFNAIDSTLRSRGGLADKDLQLPNFWADASGTMSTPFFWSILVNYSPASDPAKLASFEAALEDAITRAGYDLNVRIQRRPLRIEIDKPTPPTVTLAELWPTVAELATNERRCVVGLAFLNGVTATLAMDLTGEDFSAFIAASSGGGKTQLAMSILLSLAMTNSPASLSFVLIDPKAVDFRPFNALPHLALPVVTEPEQAAAVVQALCDEMDKRTRQAAKGDNSFFAHSVLLYVDELADLVMSLPDSEAKALADNIQRLGQKGRGVGFVVLGATQRVYDVPAAAHSKLNARFVGKMRTANDSVAASGIPGTQTNRLPGRGSFELYSADQTGLRIQAPFVAASDKPGYEQKLKPFFAAIAQRWQGERPGWTPATSDQAAPAPDNSYQPITIEAPGTVASDQASGPEVDPALVEALKEEYANDPSAFCVSTVRRVYSYLNAGKRMKTTKEKAVYQWFLDTYAATLVEPEAA